MSAIFRALCIGSLAALLLGASLVEVDAAAAAAGGAAGAAGSAGAGGAAGAAGTGAAGAAGAPGGGAGGGAPIRPSVSAYPQGREGVKALSRSAEGQIGQCAEDDKLCIADALDAYAEALRNLSPPLAPELRDLPDIVSHAARRIRQAKTKTEATAALKIAIAAVHKTIALLKADDPVVAKAETRQGVLVAETLAVADDKLEKAVGL